MRLGAFDYIEKPPDLNNLLTSVRSALKNTSFKKLKINPKKSTSKYEIIIQPYITATQSGITALSISFEKINVTTGEGGIKEMINNENGYICSKDYESISKNIIKAGEDFYLNPMDAPFIPTWSRVKSAIPDFLSRLEIAVNEDNKYYL